MAALYSIQLFNSDTSPALVAWIQLGMRSHLGGSLNHSRRAAFERTRVRRPTFIEALQPWDQIPFQGGHIH